jgi:hypothetical protein
MTIYGNIGYTLDATMVGGKMSLCVLSLLCHTCLTGGSASRSHLMRL